MEIKINTKYSIGDEVYFLNHDKDEVICGEVENIVYYTHFQESKYVVDLSNGYTHICYEKQLFSTFEEAYVNKIEEELKEKYNMCLGTDKREIINSLKKHLKNIEE